MTSRTRWFVVAFIACSSVLYGACMSKSGGSSSGSSGSSSSGSAGKPGGSASDGSVCQLTRTVHKGGGGSDSNVTMNTTAGSSRLDQCRYRRDGDVLTLGLFGAGSNTSIIAPDKSALILTWNLATHKQLESTYRLNQPNQPTAFAMLPNGKRCPLGVDATKQPARAVLGGMKVEGTSIDLFISGIAGGLCQEGASIPFEGPGGGSTSSTSSGAQMSPEFAFGFEFEFETDLHPADTPCVPNGPVVCPPNTSQGSGPGSGTLGGQFRAASGAFLSPPPGSSGSSGSSGGTSGSSGTSSGDPACGEACADQFPCTEGHVQAACYCQAACIYACAGQAAAAQAECQKASELGTSCCP